MQAAHVVVDMISQSEALEMLDCSSELFPCFLQPPLLTVFTPSVVISTCAAIVAATAAFVDSADSCRNTCGHNTAATCTEQDYSRFY